MFHDIIARPIRGTAVIEHLDDMRIAECCQRLNLAFETSVAEGIFHKLGPDSLDDTGLAVAGVFGPKNLTHPAATDALPQETGAELLSDRRFGFG